MRIKNVSDIIKRPYEETMKRYFVIRSIQHIVAYDLKRKDPEDYQELHDFLNNLHAIKIQNSVWTLKSKKTSKELLDKLKNHIKEDDKILVSQVIDFESN
jgi:CRISPR-associated endonuclease Cas2